jgi:hypothetical protein
LKALDCRRPRLHNAVGSVFPQFAPMNSAQTQNRETQSYWRRVAVTMSLSLFVCFSQVSAAAAQVGQPKRITSVWTATTAQGSRVHVVSDSPVNDYEGYTRGGQFYVKIPFADLPEARGSLLGRGFDDVKIQRYGDGIIITFRLQPGTAARVEQAANRLEVVFTTPGGPRNGVAGARETDDVMGAGGRTMSDSVGQSPATSPSSSGGGVDGRKAGRDNRNSGSSEKSGPTRPNERTPSPSPSPSVSHTTAASPAAPGLSSSASPGGSPASRATPRSSESSNRPSPTVTPNRAASSTDNDWKSRVHYWRVWAELNWVPIVIGVLIALALLVLLFFWRAAKRARGDAAEAAPASLEAVAVASPSPTREAAQSVSAAPIAAGPTQSPAARQTYSSKVAPSEQFEQQGEEPEREVFEL